MNRESIEQRLKLPLATMCMAVTVGKPGDLAHAKELVLDTVETLIQEIRLERK